MTIASLLSAIRLVVTNLRRYTTRPVRDALPPIGTLLLPLYACNETVRIAQMQDFDNSVTCAILTSTRGALCTILSFTCPGVRALVCRR